MYPVMIQRESPCYKGFWHVLGKNSGVKMDVFRENAHPNAKKCTPLEEGKLPFAKRYVVRLNKEK
jgi:hypothetical protein